ncbi:hypothetical protein RA279_28440, partial [Pseudomonas syringae pv. tagetis]
PNRDFLLRRDAHHYSRVRLRSTLLLGHFRITLTQLQAHHRQHIHVRRRRHAWKIGAVRDDVSVFDFSQRG